MQDMHECTELEVHLDRHIELYVAQMYLIKGARTHEWGLRTVLAVDKLLSIHLTLIVSSEE